MERVKKNIKRVDREKIKIEKLVFKELGRGEILQKIKGKDEITKFLKWL